MSCSILVRDCYRGKGIETRTKDRRMNGGRGVVCTRVHVRTCVYVRDHLSGEAEENCITLE